MGRKNWLIICLIFISFLFPFSTSTATDTNINIAIKEFPPFVFKELKGFCIDMSNFICKKNNLVPKYVRYDSVPDVLDAIESRECHIAFSGITITAGREKRFDFSQPFFDSGLFIAVKTEKSKNYTGLYKDISKLIAYSIIMLFCALTVVAHTIWYIEKNDDHTRSFSTRYTKGIMDAYWWAVVTMTTVGYGDKYPKKVSGKLIAAIWMIIGIMWFATFTATLSSSLTIDRIEQGKINDLSDLKNMPVGVIRGTTSENYLHFHEVKIYLAENLDDLVESLESQTVKAIVYDAPALMYIAKKNPSITVVGEMFDKQRYGLVFPQDDNSYYKEIFDIAIIDMQKTGEYQKIYDKWF